MYGNESDKNVFDYKVELRIARQALNRRVASYADQNSSLSYREIAGRLNLSVGALSQILKVHIGKRKPGRRPLATRRVTFEIRRAGDKYFETAITVIAGRLTPKHTIRHALKTHFKGCTLRVGSGTRCKNRATYRIEELCVKGL